MNNFMTRRASDYEPISKLEKTLSVSAVLITTGMVCYGIIDLFPKLWMSILLTIPAIFIGGVSIITTLLVRTKVK